MCVCVCVRFFRIEPRPPSLGQGRPTLSRWTVRVSYKSRGRPSASRPGPHDSPYPPSARTLLSLLPQSRGHCSRDRGLLPVKKAARLRCFGQDSEKTSVVHKVSVARVVGGAPAPGWVPLPLSRAQLPSCSFGAWSRVKSVLEPARWESHAWEVSAL